MPKRTSKKRKKKKKKRRAEEDVNQLAYRLVQESTSEPIEDMTKTEISRVMAAMGRKGGKIGGKRRLETMTPEQRSSVALKAAKTRWSKQRPEESQ